jgi:alkylation response protein AidB-like acyl-CoA dehydrogenase
MPADAMPAADADGSLLLTEEQAFLGSTVRGFLEDRAAERAVRRVMETADGIDRALWRDLAGSLGACGLSVPEGLGGAGATFVETALVCEELGRSLACVPYLSSVVLAQTLLLDSADPDAQARWLPGLCSGDTIATVALVEPDRKWHGRDSQLQATYVDGDWRLTGSKTYVLDGHVADVLFVIARTGAGLTIFAVDAAAPGLTRTQLPTMDQTRRLARVDLAQTPGVLVAAPGDAEKLIGRLLQVAAVAVAAESLGGAERVLEMAVDYAKVRVQFGRPIGSFQAIKHKCADMLIQVESARSAVCLARQVLGDGQDSELPIAAALAKAYCCDAYVFCAEENIQVHGGIGFTWEHPAHLYFKRARTNQVLFGDPYQHRDRIARLLLDVSDAAKYITGVTLPVDAGLTTQ